MQRVCSALAIVLLLIWGASGERRTSPRAMKVKEYSWANTISFHWECPKGWFVYWPEINVYPADPKVEIPPDCISAEHARELDKYALPEKP